ncbi:DUF6783 domain-containing protein, partial [Robinsoniella sp.]|uniref:DUF6783 domain-containing protein n=1 Tax=Robinsoniella sp. TaxID=2496533 RepID=UPI003751FF02
AKWDVQMAGRNFNTRSSWEMHQDFGANARVPPKSAPGRLENASSALSIPNQCPGPPPSLSVHYLSFTKRPYSAKPKFIYNIRKLCIYQPLQG